MSLRRNDVDYIVIIKELVKINLKKFTNWLGILVLLSAYANEVDSQYFIFNFSFWAECKV